MQQTIYIHIYKTCMVGWDQAQRKQPPICTWETAIQNVWCFMF